MRIPVVHARLWILAVALASSLSAPGIAIAADAVRITIDAATKYQTMDGFGASGAWWPSWVGTYPQNVQDELLDLLFTERGIGLSIYRYNIPAGGGNEIRPRSHRTAQVETAPGKYDLSADRAALEILRGVSKRGVQRFVLFANSPPARLTRNGLVSGGDGGDSNLRAGEEEAFAGYLVDLATQIRDQYRLPQVSLSPINEPQWKWGEKQRHQEGCHYSATEAAAVIQKVVKLCEARNAGLKVEAPESGSWDVTEPYAQAMFSDPAIRQHVHEIAIHSYWSDRASKERVAKDLAQRFADKRLAMTEYCQMKREHDVSIDSGLELARTIHDDLTIGNVVSWQWWLAIGPGGYGDALIYANPRTQKIEKTKRLWVFGQFSRFIRPGFVRIGASASDQEILATAFISESRERVACIVINPRAEAVRMTLAIAGFEAQARRWYATDADRDLAEAPRATGDEIVLAARSVNTFVLTR
jgi:O-glycosyl hydrolase